MLTGCSGDHLAAAKRVWEPCGDVVIESRTYSSTLKNELASDFLRSLPENGLMMFRRGPAARERGLAALGMRDGVPTVERNYEWLVRLMIRKRGDKRESPGDAFLDNLASLSTY